MSSTSEIGGEFSTRTFEHTLKDGGIAQGYATRQRISQHLHGPIKND